mmetsp:Transcript_133158/g.336300  ORF Transcript_133158/g.336300 Transcript_133158/m.336300 type:complete len:184 (-) Transcript_133158:213-764(-)
MMPTVSLAACLVSIAAGVAAAQQPTSEIAVAALAGVDGAVALDEACSASGGSEACEALSLRQLRSAATVAGTGEVSQHRHGASVAGGGSQVAEASHAEETVDWDALLEARGKELAAAGGSPPTGSMTCCCYSCSAGGCHAQSVGCSECNPEGCGMKGIPGGCNSGSPVSGQPYISPGFGSVCH